MARSARTRRTQPGRRYARLSQRLTTGRCFEAVDSSTLPVAATALLQGPSPRDPASQAARLAGHFIERNRATLLQVGAAIEQQYNGSRVELVIRTGTNIGAVPLVSPTTGRPDYGLVVKPRFDWPGIGPMLAEMGWRIVPTTLPLPLLPQSERKIPPWVLSSIILFRLQALLDRLERRFEMAAATRSAPRGSVNWREYATREMSHARFLSVPCRYPDLRDDTSLKAAIRYTLEKQLVGLSGQRWAGPFVVNLIELCQSLLLRVASVSPRQPAPMELEAWLRGPLKTSQFRDGLQAIEWTVDDRGLAGLSDLQGLAWVMPMDAFFEAWGETVLHQLSRLVGGVVRAGRLRQTVAPLTWEPPYLGSQKYLLPDLMLERGDTTLIVDAKYKTHWEEMQDKPWRELEEDLRERHRADLLQVLAYANLPTAKRVIACLAYPCSIETWNSLKHRGRLYHRASLRAGDRAIQVLLTAFPIGVPARQVAETMAKEVA
jgi:hypothetical protein